ncbi:MAG: GLUG motif-containing protein [Fibrobacter sp.]|nr:GLUG motif-containing protein [Fibrobacter sp.]
MGGLVGYNFNSVIHSCYSIGNVTGEVAVGGLVGWNSNGGEISSCYCTGNIRGGSRVGGLIGENFKCTINSCYSIGRVNGKIAFSSKVNRTAGIDP